MDELFMIMGVVGTALLVGFLCLRRWHGRRRIAEIVVIAAIANGAAWSLCGAAWLWFSESIRVTDISSGIGMVLYWLVLYGVLSLIPVAGVVAVYNALRKG